MQSLLTYRQNSGFTLLELLIVLGISTVIFSLGTAVSVGAYTAYFASAEKQTLVSVLHKARTRALLNVHSTAHGVCYRAPDYILFEGTTCAASASTSEKVRASKFVADSSDLQSTFPAVVFTQTTATTTPVDIYMRDGTTVQHIFINEEGAIFW